MHPNTTNIIVNLLLTPILINAMPNLLSANYTYLPLSPIISNSEVFSPQDNQHSSFDTPPKIIGGFQALQEQIKYPEEAKQQNIEGKVILEVFITEEGKVKETSVVRGIENGGLNQAAMHAVEQITFEPALLQNQPVAVKIQLPIVFKLQK